MDLTIHSTFLPHFDPEASLAFYRDALDFDIRGRRLRRTPLDHRRAEGQARHIHRPVPAQRYPGRH